MFSLPHRLTHGHTLAATHPAAPHPERPAHRAGTREHGLVDLVMPEHHFRGEARTIVETTPENVLRALDEVTLADVPLIHALVTLRHLPGRLLRRPRPQGEQPGRSLIGMAMPLRLGEDPGREIVLGTAGRLENPIALDVVDLPDLFTFTRFNDADCQKLAIGFRAIPDHGGARTTLAAEHRTLALSPASRRRFAVSWYLALGWGGDILLRQFLKAVKRRAEAAHRKAGSTA